MVIPASVTRSRFRPARRADFGGFSSASREQRESGGGGGHGQRSRGSWLRVCVVDAMLRSQLSPLQLFFLFARSFYLFSAMHAEQRPKRAERERRGASVQPPPLHSKSKLHVQPHPHTNAAVSACRHEQSGILIKQIKRCMLLYEHRLLQLKICVQWFASALCALRLKQIAPH